QGLHDVEVTCAPDVGLITEHACPRIGETDRTVGLESGDAEFQICWFERIVGIEATDVLTAREGNSRVARGRKPAIGLADQLHARWPRYRLQHMLRRRIG